MQWEVEESMGWMPPAGSGGGDSWRQIARVTKRKVAGIRLFQNPLPHWTQDCTLPLHAGIGKPATLSAHSTLFSYSRTVPSSVCRL